MLQPHRFHAHASDPPCLAPLLHEGGEAWQRGPRPRHVVHDNLRAVQADHGARGILITLGEARVATRIL